jgi:hypothetical protein
MKFVGCIEPLSFSGVDIKTYYYAMEKGKRKYRHCSKTNMPKEWFDPTLKHTHRADDDALEQGKLFIAMMKPNNG